MKIKTRKVNAYRGDKSLVIEAHLNNRNIVPIMGIWKERGEIVNDNNGRTFKSITDAKKYALENFEQFTGIKAD